MDNPEKLATQSTQDKKKPQNKYKLEYRIWLDILICLSWVNWYIIFYCQYVITAVGPYGSLITSLLASYGFSAIGRNSNYLKYLSFSTEESFLT
jgi:hypothetical protein